MAITKISHVTILVRDQDEALRWYTEVLGFEKRMDMPFGTQSRWLTVGATGQKDLEVALLKPNAEMHGADGAKKLMRRVGQGPTWVVETDSCRKTYEELKDKGVKFTSVPQDMPWGVSAVFEDLYGNQFNLLEPAPM
jgi:catechol 2,3-dioxygenase-like lactoylglutathione lyase family enzyme